MVMVLAVATPALACPVCGGAGGTNSQAYIETMVFLTTLPLTLFAGAAFVLWKLSKAAQGPDPVDYVEG